MKFFDTQNLKQRLKNNVKQTSLTEKSLSGQATSPDSRTSPETHRPPETHVLEPKAEHASVQVSALSEIPRWPLLSTQQLNAQQLKFDARQNANLPYALYNPVQTANAYSQAAMNQLYGTSVYKPISRFKTYDRRDLTDKNWQDDT